MKKIILGLMILSLFPSALSAQVSQEYREVFNNVAEVVERRFSVSDQERFYSRLATMIDTLLLRNTNTSEQKRRFTDMQKLSREKLYEIKIVDDNSIGSQTIKELRIRNSGERVDGLTPYSELQRDFRYFITDERQFLKVGDNWHGIYFDNFSFFPSDYGVSQRDLERNTISTSKTPLYRNTEGRYHFIPSYEKKVLLREDVFFGLPEKFHLLQNLHDDMRYVSNNPEQILRDVKSETERITAGKNRAQKIEIIYEYILENLSYSENFQLDDMYIYSGLEAFVRGSAVCTGYVKLMAYMLAFAGIDDFEVIRGYVIDADDFPQIGHAWIRIGDRYYDPTFDDPLGNTQTLTRDEYKYFALPRDIMYTNRFEYGALPEHLRTASMQARKDYIRAELLKLYPKYESRTSEFRVFDEIAFREKYNLSQTLPLTLARLTASIPYIEVSGEDFRYNDQGTTRQIQSLNFFTLTQANLNSLLQQIRYDFSDYQLMRWNLPDGTHEWRLGLNMVVR